MINIYQIVEKALVGKTGESSNILLKQFKCIDLYGDVLFILRMKVGQVILRCIMHSLE